MGAFDPLSNGGGAIAPRVRLEILDGPDRSLTHDLTGTSAVIGTAHDNDVVLTDPTVSRYHLRVKIDASILVQDLQSRNGTFLGDLQIREALVPLGARLRVGRTLLSLLDADVADALPPSSRPPDEIPGLVGHSAAIRDVARAIRQVAQSTASVLIQGETGTGKELVARAIHRLSPRADGPFVVVDSGALSPTLIASQLFGHERGAFTGADARREGAFELAHGGTLFLDEIGDLPLALQPSLLGVLERRSFRRLGGKQDIHVDVRVVSATHRDLRADFRSDLYFRLAVARLSLPPLRARVEDIEPLYQHFTRQLTRQPAPPMSDSLRQALMSHRWAGNVRELRNVVENIVTTGALNLDGPAGSESAAEPPWPATSPGGGFDDVVPYRVARSEAVAAFEQHYVSNLIRMNNGNASRAARVADMDRPYLLALLRKHGLRGPRDSSSR